MAFCAPPFPRLRPGFTLKRMMQIMFPALVAVLGLVGYALSSNGKVAELCRIAFFCGLFVVVWILARLSLHL